MKEYQAEFIKFLISSGVLTFGDFTTKSGRKTPYFINTGNFNTGEALAAVGSFYATHLVESGLTDIDVLFGPAYKGIPLAVVTGVSLSREHGLAKGVSFDRKEAKAHGDKGVLVGHQIKAGETVVLVEDVVTAGTTIREMVPRLRSEFKAVVPVVLIAVDRAEKGTTEKSAVTELEEALAIRIYPIVTIHDIIAFLSTNPELPIALPENIVGLMQSYLEQYGA